MPNLSPPSRVPYCLAMVLADGTHRDPETGKITILGTFHSVHARNLPAPLDFAVYFAVTDCLGRSKLRIEFVDELQHLDDDSEGPIYSAEIDIESDDPLSMIEVVVNIHVDIEREGVYYCELYARDAPLMSRRVIVKEVES